MNQSKLIKKITSFDEPYNDRPYNAGEWFVFPQAWRRSSATSLQNFNN
ncbi:MAG: hypothetical protein WBA41_32960 [Rivularia sp. (in: cyanobacteria)]